MAQTKKIGDFGLAIELDSETSLVKTKSDLESSAAISSDHRQLSGNFIVKSASMTQAIGTPFYIAPELLLKTKAKYDQKVDMYSLGIIFFECCHAFSTGMERVIALKNIRKMEIEFPTDFNHSQLEKQTTIIKVQHIIF